MPNNDISKHKKNEKKNLYMHVRIEAVSMIDMKEKRSSIKTTRTEDFFSTKAFY